MGLLIAALTCGVLVVAAAGAALYLRHSSSGSGQAATARSPEPRTVEAAKAAVQKAMTRVSAGDHEGAYDMLSGHGKTLISKDDYVRYAKACSGTAGLVAQVTDVRLETPVKAIAIVQWPAFAMPIIALYERGVWTWEPAAELAASWSKPVEQRLAEGRADGSCAPLQGSERAKVGDCLGGGEITGTTTQEIDLNIVECSDAAARYKIIGIREGVSRTEALKQDTAVCNDYVAKGAESVLWVGADVASGRALCLGPAK